MNRTTKRQRRTAASAAEGTGTGRSPSQRNSHVTDAGNAPLEGHRQVQGSDAADGRNTVVEDITGVMQALADVNRLRIVNLLLERDELCVCDIERVLAIPQTRVSRHLSILRHAGLVSARRAGRWMHYRLVTDLPLKRDLFAALANTLPASDLLARDREHLEQSDMLMCDSPERDS